MKRIIFGLAIFALIAQSCDKVEQPNVAVSDICASCDSITTFAANTNTRRNILLEEFTGHTCPNCPGGSYETEIIQGNHPGQVVVVAIHPESSFTTVQNNPDSSYSTDWTTEEGIEYHQFFIPPTQGYPHAMISRTTASGNYAFSKSVWASAVAALASDAPIVNIQSIGEYNDATNDVCVNTEIEFLTNSTGDYRVVHYLVEDSISDWQVNGIIAIGAGHPDYPQGDVSNYEHRHVLRDVFGHAGLNEGEPEGSGNVWGESLINGAVEAGTKFHILTSLCDVNAEWDKDHMYVVTYVYENSTKEVMQVIEEHLHVN
jgi:hypothetical protein